MPRGTYKEHTDMHNNNDAFTLASLFRQKSPTNAPVERPTPEESERIARAQKEQHDSVFRFIWPAQYVRRTPESPGTPYKVRLETDVSRLFRQGLGKNKIAAQLRVSRHTVNRILAPGRVTLELTSQKAA